MVKPEPPPPPPPAPLPPFSIYGYCERRNFRVVHIFEFVIYIRQNMHSMKIYLSCHIVTKKCLFSQNSRIIYTSENIYIHSTLGRRAWELEVGSLLMERLQLGQTAIIGDYLYDQCVGPKRILLSGSAGNMNDIFITSICKHVRDGKQIKESILSMQISLRTLSKACICNNVIMELV